MTTHRRAVLRSCAIAALVAAGLTGFAGPAYAVGKADVKVSPGSGNVATGQPATFRATVTVTGLTAAQTAVVTLTATAGGNEVSVEPKSTTLTFTDNGSKDKVITVTAGQTSGIPAGTTKPVQVTVTANVADGSDDTTTFTANVAGPAAPPSTSSAASVTEVSGTVKDSVTSAVIKDATVGLNDGKHTYQVASDSNGRFKFTSTAKDPISPGTLSVGAQKDGYETVPINADGRAGQAVTGLAVKLRPSASASAGAQSEAPVTDPSTEVSTAGGGNAQTPGNKTSDSGGLSTVSWVLIVLGTMLVLFPIVVIVMLMRGRNKEEEPPAEDGDPDDEPTGPRPAAPGARGAYQSGPGSDPTMVARPGGREPAMATQMMPNNMSDATAIVPSPITPGVDPYRQDGYGQDGYGQDGGYGAGYGQGGYGEPTTVAPQGYGAQQDPYTAPQDPYGAQQDPYGAPRGGPAAGGYDDPRGGYDSPRAGGYDERTAPAGYGSGAPGGYGDERGGYDDPRAGGYDERTAPAGYGPGGAGGGYGDERAGFSGGRGGYEDQRGAGYDDPRGGGYDAPRAGGGYGGDPRGAAGYGGDPRAGEPTRHGGFDERAGYGGDPRGAGYDDRAGYDDPRTASYGSDPRGAAGYDAPRGAGYDDRAGYDDPRTASYGSDPRGGAGYDDPRGAGYDDRGGRPPAAGGRGQRSVEWLDD